MNDRAALYAAILAHPDEDTPRLAFADWLEENGDAEYAALIRKQIELAKVPEWNPLWVRTWEMDRGALTGRGFDRFVPKLPGTLKLPPLTSFRRGFPWHIESTDVEPFLANVDGVLATIPLQALTVRADRGRWREPIDLTALFASPHLARLKRLSFTLTRFTVQTVRQMQACPHLTGLTELGFDFASFDTGALRELVRPPLIERLVSLSFENSEDVWSHLVGGAIQAGGPHRLRRLVVTESRSVRFDIAKVFKAPLLRGLTELEISGYERGEANVRALCESPTAAGLESLILNGAKPGVPGIKVLAGCAALSGLKRLRLGASGIGTVAAKALAGSPHLAGLRVCDLTGNPLGDKGAIALAAAPFMANLIELELMHCEIGDAGAEALMNALSADQPIHLNLYSSPHKMKLSDGTKRKLREKFGGRVFV